MIFYESPFRVKKTLKLVYEVMGNRYVVLAHELTKIHEGFFRGPLDVLMTREEALIDKGEWVILVQGNKD